MNHLRKKSAIAKVSEFLEKGLTKEEVMEALEKDKASYTPEEFAILSAEAFPGNAGTDTRTDEEKRNAEAEQTDLTNKAYLANLSQGTSQPPTPGSHPPPPPPGSINKEPSSEEGLSGKPKKRLNVKDFNYSNLIGEGFEKYVRLVGDRNFSVLNKETGRMEAVLSEADENEMHDFDEYKVEVILKDRFPGLPDTPRDFNGLRIVGAKVKTTRIPVKVAIELNAQILNAHSLSGKGTYYFLSQD